MKEYIAIGVIGVGLLATAAVVGLNSADSTRHLDTDGAENAAACPSSRLHIEASLKTTEADGMYYKLTRKSVRTPVRDIIVQMRGKTRARETAINTRNFAKEKLATGVKDGEKRYYQDTILRTEALLAILDCMEKQRAL